MSRRESGEDKVVDFMVGIARMKRKRVLFESETDGILRTGVSSTE